MSKISVLAAAAILATGLMAAKCSQQPEDVNAQADKVIAIAKQVCSFVPDVKSVIAMITSTDPNAVTGVENIANKICEQVGKLGAATGQCPWGKVNGVCIVGHKV